jgi:beta-barrel assembly-enhancing protease
MKFSALLPLLFTLCCGALMAQDAASERPHLVCEGNLPREVVTPSAVKFKKEIEQLKKEKSGSKEKKTKKQFALESNFWEDDLLQSGLVLFNDPVSVYLQEVMDQIAAQEEEGEKPVKLYALRSTAVNAFATDRGNIYVTLGMLAQLEDEAQLAFILAHELIHAREKHARDLYLKARNVGGRKTSQKELLDNVVFQSASVARNYYSKELESEADEGGLQLFLKTSYATHTLNTVFDVLRYGDSPFDNIPFDHSFLESEWYRIPAAYRLEKTKLISGADENADDTRSTHPNLSKRRQALARGLRDVSNEGKSLYLVSQERFKQLQQQARYELPMLFLQDGRLSDAIYTAWLVKQSHPESAYPEKVIAKALYLNAKYQNDTDFKYRETPYEDVEGESQQVYFLINKMPAKEASVMALRYAWSLKEKYPDDSELPGLVKDLFVELPGHFPDLFPFAADPPELAEEEEAPAVSEGETLSKYDRIRQQQQEQGDPDNYWKFAFLGYFDDPSFEQGFKDGADLYNKRKKEEEYYSTREGRKEWLKHRRSVRKNGVALDIDKVVMINPHYLRVEGRANRGSEVFLVASETGQERFRKLVTEVAPLSSLKVTLLDVSSLKESQTDRFNDIRMLNDWFSEQLRHYDLSLTPGANQEEIDAIADKYGTDYFLWTGVVSVLDKDIGMKVLAAAVSAILPPLLFLTVPELFKSNSSTYMYAMLFDVRTGRRQVLKFDKFHKGDTDAFIKAHLYDVIYQISSK